MTINLNQLLLNRTWKDLLDRVNTISSHFSTSVVTLGTDNVGNLLITGGIYAGQGNFSSSLFSDQNIESKSLLKGKDLEITNSGNINKDLDVNGNLDVGETTNTKNLHVSQNLSSNQLATVKLTVLQQVENLSVKDLNVEKINLPSLSVSKLDVLNTAVIEDLKTNIANVNSISATTINMNGQPLGNIAYRNKIYPADLDVSSLVIVPVGSILIFAGQGIPSGYLECNGQTVLRNNFSLLYDWVQNQSLNIATSESDWQANKSKFAISSTALRVPDLSGYSPFNIGMFRAGIKAS